MADRGSAVNYWAGLWTLPVLKFGLWILDEVRIIDLMPARAGM